MAVAAPATGRAEFLLFLAGAEHLTDYNCDRDRNNTERGGFADHANLA